MTKQKKEKFDAKNIKINQEELAITKIGELETAEKSPLFVFILLAILLVFIFFLPTIVNLVKGPFEKPDYSLTPNQTGNKGNEEEEEPPKESEFLTFSPTLSISLNEDIVVNTFTLEGNTISFKVTNSGATRYYFHKDNYFLELYSEEETLLERILLSSVEVSKNASEVFRFSLNANTALNMKKLKLTKKELTDYPNVVLEKNENGEDVLTCKKDHESITYKFFNDKLFSITDIVNYASNVSDYATLIQNWKVTSEGLNSREGIQSLLVDAGNGFVVNTTIDLKTAKLENSDSEVYYQKDTLAKVVKFEMDARGFMCN